MEVACSDCGNYPRKIGKEVFYCDECDRIFTVENNPGEKVMVH